jgi:DNA-binding HxlR family transcriptional regulator
VTATYARAVAGTYQQFCAVAAALDVVGDRWTLLVVRELLDGPRRYGELIHGLPGIATNLLADRLRRLEAAGLVAQEPGVDGRARVYGLTPRGGDLRPVVDSLARFGLAELPDAVDGLAFRPQWLVRAVRLLLRPGVLDDDLVVRFEVQGPDGPTVLQLRLDATDAVVDAEATPDVVVTGDPAALSGALRGGTVARGAAGAAVDRHRLAAALGAAPRRAGD